MPFSAALNFWLTTSHFPRSWCIGTIVYVLPHVASHAQQIKLKCEFEGFIIYNDYFSDWSQQITYLPKEERRRGDISVV